MRLDTVVPFGRSKREYELMFNLTAADCGKRILGCADGPASFNAEMRAAGHAVVSIDPLYQFQADAIQQQFNQSIDNVIAIIDATPENWVWSYHRDSQDLRRNRCRVMQLFVADYAEGTQFGRYIAAGLPQLPLNDQAFDLALCSHFLFLYSQQFSEQFHLDAVAELCRVAQEVRIFPLLTLEQSRSPYIEAVTAWAANRGIDWQIVKVGYELQKGGNQMLVLRR